MDPVPFPIYPLGPISYYSALCNTDTVSFDVLESFPKRTYRNRYTIINVHGYQTLTIPIEKCDSRTKTTIVKIDYSQDWAHYHIKSIKAAYGMAPFFIHYIDDYSKLVNTKFESLVEFNVACVHWILKALQLSKEISIDENFPDPTLNSDWRFNKSYNRKAGQFKTNYYMQVFEDRLGYLNNPSILDLIFNEGPNAAALL
jgi:hypothetical protein|tara:strand:- start:205 stop:804 length:600 start_codon:yes stop_codon:yes gene_type:complete